MGIKNRWIILGVMGLMTIVPAAASAEQDRVRAELDALRARIAELEAKENATWLNERRAEEVKGLIREVLADADMRASMLDRGVSAGHDGKHFFLASADGQFLMNVKGQVQFRYIYNNRSGANAAGPIGTDDEEYGFELRRTKLTFAGHVGNPRIAYSVGLSVDRNTQTVFADHAYIGYQLNEQVTIQGGEAKGPFLREEMISSSKQLTVERSLMNEFFTVGKIQGIWAIIEPNDQVKYHIAISDGVGSGESGDAIVAGVGGVAGTTKNFASDRADIAITARVDIKLAGSWRQWKEFSAWSDQEHAAFLGAAVHYESAETGDNQIASLGAAPIVAGVDQFFMWTVDGSCKQNGANVYFAAVGVHTDGTGAVPGGDNYGVVVQGGYMLIPDVLEPFVRWEWIDPSFTDEVHLVTAGANYFMNKHNAKLTVDVVWVPSGTLSVIGGSSGLGLLTDIAGNNNQTALRAQYQVLF